MKFCAIDLETMPIGAYPDNWPLPVYAGFAFSYEVAGAEKTGDYWCTCLNIQANRESANLVFTDILNILMQDKILLVFYNQEFDLGVIERHILKKPLQYDRIFDTQIMSFLLDPYGRHSLANDCEAMGIKVNDKYEIIDWLVQNVPELKRSRKQAGAHIYKAPHTMIAQRVKADTVLTAQLLVAQQAESDFSELLKVYKLMADAARLCSKLTHTGISIDSSALQQQKIGCISVLAQIDDKLAIDYGCEATTGNAFQDYLILTFDTSNAIYSDKSKKIATSIEELNKWIEDKTFIKLLYLQTTLRYILNNFIKGFESRLKNGKIHATWYHLKNYDEYANNGATSGRLSSSPNMQNVVTQKKFGGKWSLLFKEKPATEISSVIPNVRSLVIVKEGCILVSFDYSQQELRILANFISTLAGDDTLLNAYKVGGFDLHKYMEGLIATTLDTIGYAGDYRHVAKTTGFLVLYGGGASLVSENLGCTLEHAKIIKSAYIAALPGFTKLLDYIKVSSAQNGALRTLGGRLYYEKPPRYVDGELHTYGYTRLNHLIQPSAADILKKAMVEVDRLNLHDVEINATVHDQLILSMPNDETLHGNIIQVSHTMMNCCFGVHIPVDVAVGSSYGSLTAYKEV
jgi:DNA polymerase I-like protein with 3'-5' exonuclease and polymerase domains